MASDVLLFFKQEVCFIVKRGKEIFDIKPYLNNGNSIIYSIYSIYYAEFLRDPILNRKIVLYSSVQYIYFCKQLQIT